MRRTIIAGLLLLTIAGITGQARQEAAATQRRDSGINAEWRQAECRFGGIDRGGWTYREVRSTIECAVAKWPVPGGLDQAVSVATCESGLRAAAYNPTGCNGSGCLGVFQQHASYWEGRQDFWGPVAWDKPVAESGFDGRANVVVSVRMVRAQGGWSGWPGCA
jgi:hypothetical protein